MGTKGNNFKTVKKYIELGATRLGTSSGIEIIKGIEIKDEKY